MPTAVTAGATLMCAFGMGPSTLAVLGSRPLVEGKPAAVVTDIAPGANIPPFGMCTTPANPMVAAATAAALGTLTPMPCLPAVVAPWLPLAPTVLLSGVPALVQGSTCMCAYGGVIQVTMPGAMTTTVG